MHIVEGSHAGMSWRLGIGESVGVDTCSLDHCGVELASATWIVDVMGEGCLGRAELLEARRDIDSPHPFLPRPMPACPA